MSRRIINGLLIACVCLVLAGCRSDGLVTLKGKVTVDGEPAPAGISLQFQPTGTGSPSYAQTDSDGYYEAEYSFTKKGIEVGEHRVSLVPGGGGDDEAMPDNVDELAQGNNKVQSAESANKKKNFAFPDSYWGEIMKITVENKSNSIDIPLESKK